MSLDAQFPQGSGGYSADFPTVLISWCERLNSASTRQWVLP
jgi:hypothetical protein